MRKNTVSMMKRAALGLLAGGAVGAVNVAQDFRMGDVPAFRQLARAEAPALQQRAHGAVKKHRACIQRF